MSRDIQHLDYRPREPYQLDLEVFTVASLRRRGSREKVRATHWYDFHTLVCVTQGVCIQVVDFNPVPCVPGSLLVLRPGQTHSFGSNEDWDGWVVLFRPEFVLPLSTSLGDLKFAVDQQRLVEQVVLGGNELHAVTTAIEQLRKDTQLNAPLDDVHALLRHQLYALLIRLSLLQGRQQAQEPVMSPALQRFNRFHQLVEEHFCEWHQVADYARQLGYTEKSLARAVTASTGVAAKAFIAARIVLEAKRLLVHTDLPIVTIAENLGFDEPTNFSKFFKREANSTPNAFRRRHG
ncbi:AraC family transcriptional regulator [Marinobacter sp.]|uniref:AraC family transcriptional regulator n=1 Tax=Marinobacter sp. TaxID=50741 RepID=UPI0025BF7834|nr:AraC family transcriptional regulator [Marinobacter sp.]